MNPFLTCSPLPHPSHRSAIRSPHRQSHCRPVWAIYAVLKPSGGRASQPGPAGARSGERVPEGVRFAGAVAPSRRRLAAAGFLLALTTLAGSTAAETRAPSGSDMGTPAVLGLRGYQLVRTAKR